MIVVLIRHFKTPGNLIGRYIGTTDEDLAPFKDKLDADTYPEAETIYVSPLKRCIQTAEAIYPLHVVKKKEGLRECDFGRFENKNYKELAGEPAYQEWIDSGGKMKFPEGEAPEEFRERCRQAFCECINESIQKKEKTVVLVVHGGTIMSIMEAYDRKKKGFYDYQVKNGKGYVLELDEREWKKGIHQLTCVKELH